MRGPARPKDSTAGIPQETAALRDFDLRNRLQSHSGLVLRLLFRSLRSLDVGDFRRARLHGCGEHVIDLSPGGANLRCEILTEPALEGPEQRFSDEPIMFRRHAIT